MKKIVLVVMISISSLIFTEKIVDEFNIDLKQLERTLEELPEETKYNILKSPEDFLKKLSLVISDNSIDLRVVDKNNRLPSDYIPPNMINLSDYNLSTRYRVMHFVSYGVDDFVQLSEDAAKEDIEIFIASTYRSYEFQDKIFTNMKNYHGEEKAATIVAYPGASQHQLGTGVDFGSIKPSYAYTLPGQWLKRNAWKYGFSISYPKGYEDITTYMWEPWHYRYIGRDAAHLQVTYFNDLQHYLLLYIDKYREFFLKNHIQQD